MAMPGAASFSMVTRPVMAAVASCEAAGDWPARVSGAAPSSTATLMAMEAKMRIRILLAMFNGKSL
jgi:hypothetical protein